jgi:DnaJ family protein B protein 11
VEPGMKDGEEIVFFEEGEPIVDGEHGDLVFHIQMQPHDVFERRGNDVWMTLGVTLTEALGGFEKTVRHLDGHEVVLKREGVTRPGDVMVLEGEGMPVPDGGARTGSLVVTVQVRFPQHVGPKEMDALRAVFGAENGKGVVWGEVQSSIEGKRVYTDEVHQEMTKAAAAAGDAHPAKDEL